jgi:hypothetical protein
MALNMFMWALDEEPSVGVFQCWVGIKNGVKYSSGNQSRLSETIITVITNIQMLSSDKSS